MKKRKVPKGESIDSARDKQEIIMAIVSRLERYHRFDQRKISICGSSNL